MNIHASDNKYPSLMMIIKEMSDFRNYRITLLLIRYDNGIITFSVQVLDHSYRHLGGWGKNLEKK